MFREVGMPDLRDLRRDLKMITLKYFDGKIKMVKYQDNFDEKIADLSLYAEISRKTLEISYMQTFERNIFFLERILNKEKDNTSDEKRKLLIT